MKRMSGVGVLIAFLVASVAQAEPVTAPNRPVPGIRASIARVHFDRPALPTSAQIRSGRATSVATKASAAFALGFLGLLGGAWIGAALEGNCGCDDPGLQGAMIGIPVGTALGAVLGWRLAR